MKFAGIFGIILFVGLIFLSASLIIDDYETNYINGSIVNATPIDQKYLNSNFTKAEELNESFTGTYNAIKSLNDEGGGWFELFTGGALVIPIAFIESIKAIISMIVIAITMIGTAGFLLNIPQSIIFIGVTAFFIFIIIKLVNSTRQYET